MYLILYAGSIKLAYTCIVLNQLWPYGPCFTWLLSSPYINCNGTLLEAACTHIDTYAGVDSEIILGGGDRVNFGEISLYFLIFIDSFVYFQNIMMEKC